jgi:RNA polymerase sigma-70 factor (sigma-E family)
LSFERFAAEHSARLLRLAHLLTGQRQDAEDLTHDALIRMRSRWSRVAAARSPRAYTDRVLVNLYLSRQRGAAPRALPLHDEIVHQNATRPDFVASLADRDAVRTALLELPERQRAVLVLRYYELLDTREIGDVMGIGESSVRSALARGKQSLRTLLDEPELREGSRA